MRSWRAARCRIAHNRDDKIKERDAKRLTLGLSELALFNADLDGLVELDIEGVGRSSGNFVVCLHILLDGLTAISEKELSAMTRQGWVEGWPRRR